MTSQITWHQCIIFVNLTIIPQVPNEMLTKSAWIQQFPFTNLKKKKKQHTQFHQLIFGQLHIVTLFLLSQISCVL